MIFRETAVHGAFVIEPEWIRDERGGFARIWCASDFAAHGLNPELRQCSLSANCKKGTVRGMHFQAPPFEEAKLVRCTRGSIFDVALDLRPHSPSYLRHASVELSASNGHMLFIPEGCAHGFQTLEDDSEVTYQISQIYAPDSARGVRWDDPAFGIQWPLPVTVISERDRLYPDYLPASGNPQGSIHELHLR